VGRAWECPKWDTPKNCDLISLQDHHQACTRMARADYCGDGVPWTVPGTAIDIYDHLYPQIETKETQNWQIEAEWDPERRVLPAGHPPAGPGRPRASTRSAPRRSEVQARRDCGSSRTTAPCWSAASPSEGKLTLANSRAPRPGELGPVRRGARRPGRALVYARAAMPTVEFDREKTVEVDDPDLTLLEIAREAGIPHASACGGNGRCSTCRVMILEHPENLRAAQRGRDPAGPRQGLRRQHPPRLPDAASPAT
jgi:ferredoxin